MIQFLKESYCTGMPPAGVSSDKLFVRNSLVSRMMLAKGRIKVLCAPSMMGKTSLACQYASSSRSFEDVLWVNVSHPRFLRGFYDGELGESICKVVSDGALLVFEDVPCFADPERLRFKAACLELAGKGMEVLVTCLPGGNPFEGDSEGCEVLFSEDLMYSDEEIAGLRRQGYLPMDFRFAASRAERIPGLLNRSSGGVESFLIYQQVEAENAFQRILTYAILLISQGTLDDLSYVLGASVKEGDLKSHHFRPYITELDFGMGFVADGFPAGDVLDVFKGQLSKLCSNGLGFDADSFACRIADVLLRRRSVDKAAKVMSEICSPAVRAAWLAENGRCLLEAGSPVGFLLLLGSLDSRFVAEDARLGLFGAEAYFLVGEESNAFSKFNGIACDSAVPMSLRLEAAAFAALSSKIHPSALDFGESFGEACLLLRKRGSSGPLLKLWNALLEGDSGVEQLVSFKEGDGVGEWLLAVSCCLHGLAIDGRNPQSVPTDGRALNALLARMASVVEECVSSEVFEACLFVLHKELGSFGSGPHFSRAAVSAFDQIGARMRVQRSAYGKLSSGQGSAASSSGGLKQDALRFKGSVASVMSVPVLEVRMFGRFEVLIGGNPVDRSLLSRLKVRSLLVMLALEPGRDFSCERLSSILWPDSTPEKARRNFYSIYSILKRALSLGDGSCPYLTRSQGVCKLNALYVRTDAGEMVEICQRMRYGDLSGSDSAVLLERMRSRYRGELLPSERVVYGIEAMRRIWRNRVVDALIAAARRLRDAGEYSIALEYSAFAFECNPQREDVCEMTMLLQCAMKQRAGAIETFFEFQKINRELGLDISPAMQDFYKKVITDGSLPNRLQPTE